MRRETNFGLNKYAIPIKGEDWLIWILNQTHFSDVFDSNQEKLKKNGEKTYPCCFHRSNITLYKMKSWVPVFLLIYYNRLFGRLLLRIFSSQFHRKVETKSIVKKLFIGFFNLPLIFWINEYAPLKNHKISTSNRHSYLVLRGITLQRKQVTQRLNGLSSEETIFFSW